MAEEKGGKSPVATASAKAEAAAAAHAQAEKAQAAKPAVFCVGVDMGTVKSYVYGVGIAGDEETDVRIERALSSRVGFAQDNAMAKRTIKRRYDSLVVTGDEVFKPKNVRLLDVHFPLKNGADFHEKTLQCMEAILEHQFQPFIEHKIPLSICLATPSVIASSYTEPVIKLMAEIVNKNGCKENRLFIESEPFFAGFAICEWHREYDESVTIVDVGGGTTDILIYDGNESTSSNQLTLYTAGNAVTDRLIEEIKGDEAKGKKGMYPLAAFTYPEIEELKNRHAYVKGFHAPDYDALDPVTVDLKVGGVDTPLNIAQPLEKASRILIGVIVDGVKKLYSTYQEKLPESVVLAGCAGQTPGLKEAVEEGLRRAGLTLKVTNLRGIGRPDGRSVDPRTLVAEGAYMFSRVLGDDDWEYLR